MDNLKELYSVSRAIKSQRIVSLFAFVVAIAAIGIAFWMYRDMTSSIWVRNGADYFQVDRKKQVSLKERQYDYKEHVTKSLELAYALDEALDEGSYDENMDQMMIYMGECGKELYYKYQEAGTKNYLIQNNAVSRIDSLEIYIDMEQYPAKGKARFIQTFSRFKDQKKRRIEGVFYIYDVGRWDKNKLGAKMEDWKYKIYDLK